MFKRLYQFVAWLALANLLAFGGLIGYMVNSGRLTGERVEQIAAVLRGETPQPVAAASQPTSVAHEDNHPQNSREELARLAARKQFYELISEREQREIEDRNSLNQSIQLDVNRQLEQIQASEQRFEENREKTQKALSQDGFQQSLEIFSDMEPKLAKDVLMTRKDADVVQLFMKMDTGRRKKILNTCKTPEEKAWISRVLTQMRALDTQAGADSQADATAKRKPTGGPIGAP